MDPVVLVALINGVALLLNAYFTFKTSLRAAAINQNMQRLEENTNSKMDKLGEALEAKGLAQGKIEGRAAERNDAASERAGSAQET